MNSKCSKWRQSYRDSFKTRNTEKTSAARHSRKAARQPSGRGLSAATRCSRAFFQLGTGAGLGRMEMSDKEVKQAPVMMPGGAGLRKHGRRAPQAKVIKPTEDSVCSRLSQQSLQSWRKACQRATAKGLRAQSNRKEHQRVWQKKTQSQPRTCSAKGIFKGHLWPTPRFGNS